ncbi:MAG: hypothetical protein ACLRSW_07230 [Christensenellaceae bacterium]
MIDSSVMGKIDEQVITALFGTQQAKKARWAYRNLFGGDLHQGRGYRDKTARVEIFDLRVSRFGRQGVVIITGEIGDVTRQSRRGRIMRRARACSATSVIAAPHEIFGPNLKVRQRGRGHGKYKIRHRKKRENR